MLKYFIRFQNFSIQIFSGEGFWTSDTFGNAYLDGFSILICIWLLQYAERINLIKKCTMEKENRKRNSPQQANSTHGIKINSSYIIYCTNIKILGFNKKI